jgi:hypothetical protein
LLLLWLGQAKYVMLWLLLLLAELTGCSWWLRLLLLCPWLLLLLCTLLCMLCVAYPVLR